MYFFGVKRPLGAKEVTMEQSGWMRLHASNISSETKAIYIISSRKSILSTLIKIYLQSSLSSSNEVFFTARTLHWTTGSTVKSVTLSHNAHLWYLYDWLALVFSVITIFDATLFCGDFNSSRFWYCNVIIILIYPS